MLIHSYLLLVCITYILPFHAFVEPLQSDKKLVDITVHATSSKSLLAQLVLQEKPI